LYDLATDDPSEHHDAAAAHPDVVARIEAVLKTARAESGDCPLKDRSKKR
jgi:hypothetical protein